MTERIYKSFVFGDNDSAKLDILYDPCPIHPWYDMDMVGQLDQWDENAGFVPPPRSDHSGRGNKDAVGFTCPEDVQTWLDDLQANGKWGVAFGIYCYSDCNSTMKLLENVDWNDTNCDGVITMDSDSFQKYVGDNPNDKTDADRIQRAVRLLRDEFKVLECYISGACFYGSLLRKCGHCDSWIPEDKIGGYYGCDDEIELARDILWNFNLKPGERESFDAKFLEIAV